MKNSKISKDQQLELLKQDLNSVEIEDRLEMVQLTSLAAEACCVRNNSCCHNTGCDCGGEEATIEADNP